MHVWWTAVTSWWQSTLVDSGSKFRKTRLELPEILPIMQHFDKCFPLLSSIVSTMHAIMQYASAFTINKSIAYFLTLGYFISAKELVESRCWSIRSCGQTTFTQSMTRTCRQQVKNWLFHTKSKQKPWDSVDSILDHHWFIWSTKLSKEALVLLLQWTTLSWKRPDTFHERSKVPTFSHHKLLNIHSIQLWP